jgi:hypothetical protein
MQVVRLKIASPDHVKIENLADRMRKEVVARRAVVVSYGLVGAWSRKAIAHDIGG